MLLKDVIITMNGPNILAYGKQLNINMGENETLTVQFNESIIAKAKELKIQLDLLGSVLFVLFGLAEGKVKLLHYADDSNKERRMIILYRSLELKGFLEKTVDSNVIYQLTTKGSDFINYVKENSKEIELETFIHNIEPLNEDSIESDITEDLEAESVGAWIKDYVRLFPAGRVEGGRILRSSPMTLIGRMKAFIKKHGFDKEIILKATKFYVDDMGIQAEGHKYTRTAQYFISKDKGTEYISDLATWCQRVVDGDFENKHEYFDQDVV